MSTEAATITSTTLTRLTCAHGMPSPASCTDCMDEGIFLPKAALRARPGVNGTAGGHRLNNDCTVQAITNALGADYLEAAEALLAAGWTPGKGATVPQIHAAVTALGFTLTSTGLDLTGAARNGGTFIAIGYRGRRAHAWTIGSAPDTPGYVIE